MQKSLLVLVFLLFNIFLVFAAISPEYKECLQRGYTIGSVEEITGNFCIFPDGQNCPIEKFNNNTCGIEYKNEDYCVKEGLPVWDKEKCCEGTTAYLSPDVSGQARCINISKTEIFTNQIKIYGPLFFLRTMIYILSLIALGFLIWFIIHRIKKK